MVLRRDDGKGALQTFATVPAAIAAAGLASLDSSWKRCQERYNFSRSAKPHVTTLTSREVSEKLEPLGERQAMIQSELEFLCSSLRAADFCASFSDMAGIILQFQADSHADPLLEIERPGAIWAEGVAGTNGVGTCVVERRPTVVIGGSHFFREYASLSCVAAPVLSADGEMIGILNVSTANPNVTAQAFSLIANLTIMTAERLSNQFFLNRFRQHTIMKVGGGGASTILLALDGEHRIIGANQGARAYFGWADNRRQPDLWSVFERSAAVVDSFARSDHLRDLRRIDNKAGCDATLLRPQQQMLGNRTDKSVQKPPCQAKRPSAARRAPAPLTIENCLGADPEMRDHARLLRRTLNSGLPILLLGETGVGKDTLAKVIHGESERRNKAFLAFNCASVPESLIDSELFGYGVGAFTGAKRDGNIGRLQQADGGTLFLDEIGDMPLALQTRLLRVLESGEISALGSSKIQHIDVNIIAATNNDVRKAIAEGRFRQDLYYRLAGVVVELQPLRERPDFADLVHALLASEPAAPEARLTDQAMDALMRYGWPGNIRELKFVLHRARRVCENGEITVEDLHLPRSASVAASGKAASANGDEPRQALHDAERRVIIQTLAAHGGDVTGAARALDMSRATLYRKIKQHGLGSQKAALCSNLGDGLD